MSTEDSQHMKNIFSAMLDEANDEIESKVYPDGDANSEAIAIQAEQKAREFVDETALKIKAQIRSFAKVGESDVAPSTAADETDFESKIQKKLRDLDEMIAASMAPVDSSRKSDAIEESEVAEPSTIVDEMPIETRPTIQMEAVQLDSDNDEEDDVLGEIISMNDKSQSNHAEGDSSTVMLPPVTDDEFNELLDEIDTNGMPPVTAYVLPSQEEAEPARPTSHRRKGTSSAFYEQSDTTQRLAIEVPQLELTIPTEDSSTSSDAATDVEESYEEVMAYAREFSQGDYADYAIEDIVELDEDDAQLSDIVETCTEMETEYEAFLATETMKDESKEEAPAEVRKTHRVSSAAFEVHGMGMKVSIPHAEPSDDDFADAEVSGIVAVDSDEDYALSSLPDFSQVANQVDSLIEQSMSESPLRNVSDEDEPEISATRNAILTAIEQGKKKRDESSGSSSTPEENTVNDEDGGEEEEQSDENSTYDSAPEYGEVELGHDIEKVVEVDSAISGNISYDEPLAAMASFVDGVIEQTSEQVSVAWATEHDVLGDNEDQLASDIECQDPVTDNENDIEESEGDGGTQHIFVLDSIESQGSKAENEDVLFVDESTVILLDGATSVGTVKINAKWLTDRLVEELDETLTNSQALVEDSASEDDIRAAFAMSVNEAMKSVEDEYSSLSEEEQGDYPPSAVGAVARVYGDKLAVMLIGDVSFYVVLNDGSMMALAQDPKLLEHDRLAKNYIQALANYHEITYAEAAKLKSVAFFFEEVRYKMNTPEGYAAFAPGMVPIAPEKVSVFDVDAISRIVAYTDGFDMLGDEVLSQETPLPELAEKMREIEHEDVDFSLYKRFKMSDDATAIVFEVR